MNQWLSWSLAGTVSAFALVSFSTGCGGGASGNQGDSGKEASTNDTGMADNTQPEDHNMPSEGGKKKDTGGGSMDSGVDTAVPEGGGEGGPAAPDGGVQLVNGVMAGLSGVQILGVTDDSAYVIYFGTKGTGSSTTAGVYAAPVSGSGPIVTVLGTGAETASVIHKTVFVWTTIATNKTTGNNIGTLSAVWTSGAAKATALTITSSVAGVEGATPDGTKIVYTTNCNPGGTFGDLVVANSDGTGTKTLLADTTTNATGTASYFDPEIEFVNDGYLAMTHEDGIDGGSTAGTEVLSSWDTTKWKQVDLLTDPLAYGWSTGMLGNTIAVATSAGALQLIPTAGPASAAVSVDTTVTTYNLLDDETAVLYTNMAGGFKSAPVKTPTPTTIMPSGFGGFIDGCEYQPCSTFSESFDNMYTAFYTAKGKTTGEFDINFVKDIKSATPTSLLSAGGAIFNDAFSADSKNILYYSNFSTVGTPAFGQVGDLYAYPVDNSMTAPGVSVSKNAVWLSGALTGSKIVYGDNFIASSMAVAGGFLGYEDIKVVDLSAKTLNPQLIMAETDVAPDGYYITYDRKTIIWAVSVGSMATDGIWSFVP